MPIEVVDSVEWSKIRRIIDNEFGPGVTQGLRGELAPVVIRSDQSDSYYLIPIEWLKQLEIQLQDFEIKSIGIWLGDRTRGHFRVGLPVIEKLGRLTRNKIIVLRRGAESFTYGRSILKESLVKMPRGLKRGQKVVVYSETGDCLGLASLTVDYDRIGKLQPDSLVAKNLTDIGQYIRHFR